jgi:hypothetical protein
MNNEISELANQLIFHLEDLQFYRKDLFVSPAFFEAWIKKGSARRNKPNGTEHVHMQRISLAESRDSRENKNSKENSTIPKNDSLNSSNVAPSQPSPSVCFSNILKKPTILLENGHKEFLVELGIALQESPPSDQKAKKIAASWHSSSPIVALIYFDEEEKRFLEKLSQALHNKGIKTKSESHKEFQISATIRLILATEKIRTFKDFHSLSEKISFLRFTPIFELASVDSYQEIAAKRALWNELCSHLLF